MASKPDRVRGKPEVFDGADAHIRQPIEEMARDIIFPTLLESYMRIGRNATPSGFSDVPRDAIHTLTVQSMDIAEEFFNSLAARAKLKTKPIPAEEDEGQQKFV